MRTTALISLACFLLISMTACARNTSSVTDNHRYKTKEVQITDRFSALTLNGSPDVYYTQTSGKVSVEIYAASNIIPYIETFVKDGTLIVQIKRGSNLRNTGKIEVRVSAPELSAMTVNGSGDIYVEKGISTENNLNFKVQGSGDIKARKIKCNRLNAYVHGSGDIKLSEVSSHSAEVKVHGSGDIFIKGTTRDAHYQVHGSGDIHAQDMKANNVDARVSGSGDIRCFATDQLTGRVSGSGDVGYKGNPEINFSKKGLYRL
ncbi:DUF2807 domain-containing protein [Bacteroides sp. OttesenSCG-928-D19]|nr:DUF2807 domain-containing protein [Bacteroides sp. OttesenSCG-928-N06]MDL2305854.1 DUF2807 domain-containing protein [Bacteroides sp. OttesenSCG-928-D19]